MSHQIKLDDSPHSVTPLIFSDKLTKLLGKGPVYLKLDNLQPSGSFKIRGIGRTCLKAKSGGAVTIVGSSGGNAGKAMAYAAKKLGLKSELFIPTSTPQMMIDKIKTEGAEVHIKGDNWNEANEEAQSYMANAPEAFFVHPFNQSTTWEGHSTIVDEIKDQLVNKFQENQQPAAIITVAGGGGLAIGILLGIRKHKWSNVPLIVMETDGAKSFNEALNAKEVVKLDAIKSIATSLGSLYIQKELLDMAQSNEFSVFSGVVSDRSAVDACLKFADDHRMLVEPACGAGLSSIYSDQFYNTKHPLSIIPLNNQRPIVLVVCGGDIVSLELLQTWKHRFSL